MVNLRNTLVIMKEKDLVNSMLLETIKSPHALKSLTFEQLEKLAAEIREVLVSTVSQTGGHLAPNLGVVELTLALHTVFNTPRDKMVWDVGHQAYVHKLLTGRYERFSTLRQAGGISGFPKIVESPHDAFGTGHSSTSISAALGIALARDLNGESHHVIAIIGDGSLTGGQAYEAMNHAGHLGVNMTVILNDNEMSISKNVGAISEYLAKMRTAPTYSKVKNDVEHLLRRFGDQVAKTAERVKGSLKYLLVPGVLFEELGFTYFGPIDGHNLPLLTEVLQSTKSVTGPVLIHVVTCKGKGYVPAECHADKFHGIAPFCIETGKVNSSGNGNPSYTQIFGETLTALAETDPDIVAITAAMPDGTGLKSFANRFPERFFDVGIAEPHAVTLAAGLAARGKKPVVAVYSTFAQRAYDQILHDICLQNLPVVLVLDRAGIVGEDGPTHHGMFDFSYLRHIPHLTIMAPKDENELRHMLYTAFQLAGPVVIRYPRGQAVGVPIDMHWQALTTAETEDVADGCQVAILSIGTMWQSCRMAREILASRGITAGLVNARYISPLDGEMLRRVVQKTPLLVTVEDNVLAGGFGSAVLEQLNHAGLHYGKVLRLGWPNEFIPQGSRGELLSAYGLGAEGIADSVQDFVTRWAIAP
ncbi:MAG TPA: 1-deoxy-D-xylulose-5-phosphate synthase [Patescibacteria group bacterium]|nr:1-deoxy-D-xylulose-5-phosphate synthase [Patescibacteria group bacterium]